MFTEVKSPGLLASVPEMSCLCLSLMRRLPFPLELTRSDQQDPVYVYILFNPKYRSLIQEEMLPTCGFKIGEIFKIKTVHNFLFKSKCFGALCTAKLVVGFSQNTATHSKLI